MRTRTIIGTLVLIGLFCAPAFAFDPDNLNIAYFNNKTKRTIEYIFLSPGDSEYWGPEILGSERVLDSGERIGYYILYPNVCDDFDIMAIDEDGNTFIIYDYEICDSEEAGIDIYSKALRKEAPDMDFVEIHINNETIPIHFIFISPSDSQMWGVDLLDEETILESDEYFSLLFPAGNEPTTYDLLGVDEDGDTYRFSYDVDSDSDDLTFSIELSDLE